MKENASIVIVGCGISGFTAAATLLENGFSDIVILEAGNRIGGRILTTKFADGLIDLGAQWCHGIEGNIVHQLSGSESFSETVMNFSKMTFARSDGAETEKESCENLMKMCDNILKDLKADDCGTVDDILSKNFCEALKGEKFEAVLAHEVLENFKKRESSYCGSESLKQISVDGFRKFKDCDGPTWLNWKGKGYQTIFDNVLKSSKIPQSAIDDKIIFNKDVSVIDYSGSSKVAVKCSDGSVFEADHVLVTVSLGVLKENFTKLFTPELPIEKKNAIREIQFGAVGKIFLEFDKKFWSDDWVGVSLLWQDKDLKQLEKSKNSWLSNLYCFYTVDYMPNVLLGRLAGDKISEMENASRDDIVKSCEYIFEKFLRKDVKGKIVHARTSKWKTDELFLGTYSYQIKDDASVRNLSAPLCDNNGQAKVLFAGEATHEHFFSTVHGALESGIREAKRIVNMYLK